VKGDGEVGGGSEASGRYSEPGYLDLPLRAFLGLLADDQPAPAGGAAAALGVALAASLCAMAARLSRRQLPEAAELAAEATRLADMVAPLAQADAEAYRAVIAARSRPTGAPAGTGAPAEPGAPAATDDDQRRRRLAAALSDAADVPMRVAEIGAQVAALAARLAVHGHPNLHGDAITAALLAEAGTRSACALVRINLSAAESDERLARVARLLAAMPSADAVP
jgi:formiminotetrahydrofolate cyclodeaminase